MRKVAVGGLALIAVVALSIWQVPPRWRAHQTRARIESAEALIGLRFDDAKRDLMWNGLKEQAAAYDKIRSVALGDDVAPALVFRPWPIGMRFPEGESSVSMARRDPAAPADLEQLAFASVAELSELLHQRKVTSEALTRLFLARLKRFDPQLLAVVSLTEERALAEARAADAELAAGKWRGPLHGVPYGAKDLLAARGAPTTWGSPIFKSQTFDKDAAAIRKLTEAGAVLLAKLSLGELAWGDVWYGGQTKNPWNPARGSSGSSAGPASAVAAGLIPFALGSETLGSIVSPATECGVTGLRPSFGRVARSGAMALAWSMDKLGPLCRSAEDCALVLDAIRGSDQGDAAAVDAPLRYAPRSDLRGVRLGVLQAAFDRDHDGKENDLAALEPLRKLGATLVPFELPALPIAQLTIMLTAEASAAFDELTRSGKDAQMVRQIENAWPNVFRRGRLIPAVEYIQASRVRALLIEEMAKRMAGLDALVAPSKGELLVLTNLTGHPAVVVPDGFTKDGVPTSLTFVGQLLREGEVLSIAQAWQDATRFHLKRPPLVEANR
jgi:Asp-tRNA(Asn)/Glu-tRNA(Gln) amidotransferase A subunit family amidase